MSRRSGSNPMGVYIHVPFCERLCPYCDFAVSVKVEIPHREYTDAVICEMQRRRDEVDDHWVRTVYFGGGTPSLLAPEMIGELIDEVDRLFGMQSVQEVTLEANASQVTPENLKAWKEIGINRLSIGCQSFQDRHLAELRRTHNGEQARRAARQALTVMERVSIDLMFAGPSQSMQEWEADLVVMQELVKDHGLDHVSGYNLTIEPGTAFSIRQKRGTLPVPDEETSAAMLDRLAEAATEVGLIRYEVSNFSIPDGESRHNSAYWRGIPYFGLGVGAHGLQIFDDGSARRRSNSRRYDDYIADPGVPAEVEDLRAKKHLAERLFLGARSTFGVDLQVLKVKFEDAVGTEHFDDLESVLEELVGRRWMQNDDGVYRPTNRGLNFSDSLAEWLFEAAT